jgi:hypothetical protein
MTQEELKQILFYCAITGHFTWLKTNSNRTKCGTRAGCIHPNGYRRIGINGKLYYEHHLAWLYHYGNLPIKQIDHINGDKTDNRIDNLREATHAQNQQNKGKAQNNTSGYTGVTFDKAKNKWKAAIYKDRKRYHLGYYDTPEEAHAAYLKAKAEFHTFNPVPR